MMFETGCGKITFLVCKQQRTRPACTSVQAGLVLPVCYSNTVKSQYKVPVLYGLHQGKNGSSSICESCSFRPSYVFSVLSGSLISGDMFCDILIFCKGTGIIVTDKALLQPESFIFFLLLHGNICCGPP